MYFPTAGGCQSVETEYQLHLLVPPLPLCPAFCHFHLSISPLYRDIQANSKQSCFLAELKWFRLEHVPLLAVLGLPSFWVKYLIEKTARAIGCFSL